ncbi:MAG: transporter, partial [Polaromonas sp.]|nr:transporter [Polaromonas sp.]
KRSMIAGLLLLGCASALGGLAQETAWLLASRALEGIGFLWVVLPGPSLVRQLVVTQRLNTMLGAWSAYMPLGMSLALLCGPLVIYLAAPAWGWRIWWWLLSVLAAVLALLLALKVPADGDLPSQSNQPQKSPNHDSNKKIISLTLRSPAVWLMALTFAMYSGQWAAVIGFLPSIYAQAGLAAGYSAWLTAGVASVNILGNLLAGVVLGRGAQPWVLMMTGFSAMAIGSMLAFGMTTHPVWQYAGMLVFSLMGGLIPATLFSQAVKLAPRADAISTTVGWIQQWSALGQFSGPPLVAWVAVQAGGWQLTGWFASACCITGAWLAWQINHLRSSEFTTV